MYQLFLSANLSANKPRFEKSIDLLHINRISGYCSGDFSIFVQTTFPHAYT
jgi:hypothetical protein